MPESNLIRVGNDIYDLNGPHYKLENVLGSIARGGNLLYFKIFGRWYELHSGNIKSLDDLLDPEKAVPEAEVRTWPLDYWYGLGEIEEEFEPIYSTYKFIYDMPAELILEGEEIAVDVTLGTDLPGAVGYDAVRFEFDAAGPEGSSVTFKATDTNNVEHAFTDEGFWGPPEGFPLDAAYTATTAWTLNFSNMGEYTVNFRLVDLDNSNAVIAEARQVVSVHRYSTYAFSYDIPELVLAGSEASIPLTFAAELAGNLGYDPVRFAFSVEGPGNVTFKATDSAGKEHTFVNSGFWGPAEGFALPAEYSAVTDWSLTFSQPGDYRIAFSLIDPVTAVVIANIAASADVRVEDPVELALAAIDAYLADTPYASITIGAIEGLEGDLDTLGLLSSDWADLDQRPRGGKERKTAVFKDLQDNRPEGGYDPDTFKDYFNAMVATRLATQASFDHVNGAATAEELGISWVTDLLAPFEAAAGVYGSHSGIALSEKVAALQDLIDRYSALPEEKKEAALLEVLEGAPYPRSEATLSALSAAILEIEINARPAITSVSVDDIGCYKSTADPDGVRVLGYMVTINLDADGSGQKIKDTESIRIELYKDDALLGWQEFNERGYGKHGDAGSTGGCIDVAGRYKATSWDHEWLGGITDIPDKAVAIVDYKDGTATVEQALEFTEDDTKVFFAAAAVHALFEDVFAGELVLADGVTSEAIADASALVEGISCKPAENKAILQGLVKSAYIAKAKKVVSVTYSAGEVAVVEAPEGFHADYAAGEFLYKIAITADFGDGEAVAAAQASGRSVITKGLYDSGEVTALYIYDGTLKKYLKVTDTWGPSTGYPLALGNFDGTTDVYFDVAGGVEAVTFTIKLLDAAEGWEDVSYGEDEFTRALPVEAAARAKATKAAIDAINTLPALEELTLADKEDVENARSLVTGAIDAGAAEGDINNLDELEAAEAKIALLETAYTLTYSADTGGNIEGKSEQTVLYGKDGEPVTAVPDEGFLFAGWSDDVAVATRRDTNVTADLDVTALFGKIGTAEISVTVGKNPVGSGSFVNTTVHAVYLEGAAEWTLGEPANSSRNSIGETYTIGTTSGVMPLYIFDEYGLLIAAYVIDLEESYEHALVTLDLNVDPAAVLDVAVTKIMGYTTFTVTVLSTTYREAVTWTLGDPGNPSNDAGECYTYGTAAETMPLYILNEDNEPIACYVIAARAYSAEAINLEMYSEVPQHLVTFSVTSAEDGRPIENAGVTADGVTLDTGSEGTAVFKLAEGVYNYTVAAPGFKTAEEQFVVDGAMTIDVILVEEESTSAVTFRIKASDGVAPIAGASVQVGEKTKFTDASGAVVFELADGSYDYEIVLDGYITRNGAFQVAGLSQAIDITLLSEEEYVDQPTAQISVAVSELFGVKEFIVTVHSTTLPGTAGWTLLSENGSKKDFGQSYYRPAEGDTMPLFLFNAAGEVIGTYMIHYRDYSNEEVVIESVE